MECLPDLESRQRVPGAVGFYVRFLTQGGAYGVFVFWIIVSFFGGYYAGDFLASLTDESDSLSPTLPGIIADTQLYTYFPLQGATGILTILVTSSEPGTVVGGPMYNFLKDVEMELWSQSQSEDHQVLRIETPFNTTTSFFIIEEQLKDSPGGSESFNLSNIGCDMIVWDTSNTTLTYPFCVFDTVNKHDYFSADEKTALLILRVKDQWLYMDWFADVVETVANKPEHANVVAKSTSNVQMNDKVLDGLEADLLLGDAISIPTAIVVLCWTLRSFRYVFVPLASIIGGVAGSFLVMTPLAHNLPTSSVAPNMIMVLTIALAVDYNLFLLSRWREECRTGIHFEQAITNMLKHAGHTVLVSGITLKACCWTMWLLPLDILRSLGTASAVAVLMSMLVNLTFIPALLAVFPRYFTRATQKSCCGGKSKKHANYDLMNAHSFSDEGNSSSLNNFFDGNDDDEDEPMLDFNTTTMINERKPQRRSSELTAKQSGWYKFGTFLTKGYRPWVAIALVAAMCGALVDPALTFARIGGMQCLAPVNIEVSKTSARLGHIFGAGRDTPYTLVVVDASPTNDNTKTRTNNNTNTNTTDDDDGHNNDDHGDMIPHTMMLYEQAVVLLNQTQMDNCKLSFTFDFDAANDHAAVVWLSNFTGSSSAVMVEFTLSVDPWNGVGTTWLLGAREFMDSHSTDTLKYYIASGASVDIDIVVENYNAFPIVIGAVAALILLFMTMAFRSLVLPLKAVISIALTLSLVYGSAKFVYENGALDWLGFYGLSAAGGLCWIPPVLIFPMLIGFGLDYHIFLLSRVIEYRKMGHSERESVVLGLAKSGRVITSAGVIMALAFTGQLPSHELILAQLSYIVIVSVLADTFIIRAILVPSMMAVIGKYNWWPRKMPAIKEEIQHSDISMLDILEPSDNNNINFLDP